MSAASRLLLLGAALLVTPAVLSAQASSPSPTLPSDTLEANFAPRSAAGPTPELAPTLPSDTLKATQPAEWGETLMPREETAPEEAVEEVVPQETAPYRVPAKAAPPAASPS